MILTRTTKAFTIAELLVVLVISAIVVSLAIVVLLLVQKQMQSIQSIERKKQEMIFLERALWQDLNQGSMYYTLKEQKLTKYTQIDTVRYLFNDGYVLRNKDTIHVEVVKIRAFLDGHEMNEGDVDAIEVLFSKKFHHKELFVSKRMDASFYMN